MERRVSAGAWTGGHSVELWVDLRLERGEYVIVYTEGASPSFSFASPAGSNALFVRRTAVDRVSSSGNCIIGDNVTIRYDSIIARGIKIGDGTYICPKVMTNNLNTEHEQIGGAHIGKNVFIGTGCVIQHGIEIGDNTVLGSMSFINKNVPKDEVWFGNPAKFQKKIKKA